MEKTSGSEKLIRLLLRRSVQVLRSAVANPSLPDVYRSIGMASELIDDADKILCSLPDSAVLGSRKTFEELTGKKLRTRAAHA